MISLRKERGLHISRRCRFFHLQYPIINSDASGDNSGTVKQNTFGPLFGSFLLNLNNKK